MAKAPAVTSKAYEKKNDIWADNIHLKKHEDPAIAERLQRHNSQLDEKDIFVDFIKHCDN